MPGHGARPHRAGGGPTVQAMPVVRIGEEGARRTRAAWQTDLGGWEGRRLTRVGCPWWRVGGRSAQWWQTRGEIAGVGGDGGEQQDVGGVLEEVAAG
jgi:hypothetical protein